MPNSKCEKCSLYIDDIVKSKNEKITFVKLLHKRIKKIFGIPFKISPGIRHNEICGSKCNCDGVLYYEPFATHPKNFKEFDFNELFLDFDLDDIINRIKKN